MIPRVIYLCVMHDWAGQICKGETYLKNRWFKMHIMDNPYTRQFELMGTAEKQEPFQTDKPPPIDISYTRQNTAVVFLMCKFLADYSVHHIHLIYPTNDSTQTSYENSVLWHSVNKNTMKLMNGVDKRCIFKMTVTTKTLRKQKWTR